MATRGEDKRKLLRSLLGSIRPLWIAAKDFDNDHGFLLAAGVSFNLLLCLIPLGLLMLAVVGTYLYTDEAVIRQIQQYAKSTAPSLDPEIMGTISSLIQDRQIFGFLGIIGLVWTSTWVFASLRSALNLLMKIEQGRSFLWGKAIDLLMIFILLFFLLASMVLTPFATLIQDRNLPINIDPFLQWIMKYAVPFFFTACMFFITYKVVPKRRIRLPIVLKAALFGSLMWEVVKHLFGWYVLHLSRFSVMYGSLSTIAIFFFWIYYSSVILLLGGKLTYNLQKGRTDSSTS